MAKTKPKAEAKPPKAEKKSKKASDSAASVGPVTGTLEATADKAASQEAPKRDRTNTDAAEKLLKGLFLDIAKALSDTHGGPKQPRQLRWALKSLDAAKDLALRHIKHNV